jgi:hypothetical protein
MIAVRLTPDIKMIAVASPQYLAHHGEPRAFRSSNSTPSTQRGTGIAAPGRPSVPTCWNIFSADAPDGTGRHRVIETRRSSDYTSARWRLIRSRSMLRAGWQRCSRAA